MLHSHIHFEEFELDVEGCELRRAGRPIRLERLPMELLLLLLQHPGKLVSREAIDQRLWGGNVFVETEHSINTAVNKLRAVFRDDSRNPRFIRTVVGQGYCFIAKVSALDPVEQAGRAGLATVAALSSRNGAGPSSGQEESSIAFAVEEPPLPSDLSPMPDASEVEEVPVPAAAHSNHPSRGSVRDFRYWRIVSFFLASLSLLAAVAVAVYWSRRHDAAQSSSESTAVFRSVAVLPFRDLAENSNQDYLVDGMTDQLITNLARSTSLRVISHRSTMQYKGVEKPIQEIARELNVDAIVEGTYLRAGEEVRITAQLVDAQHDRQLWAQSYEESDRNLLAMQDEVTRDIAREVALSLGSPFTASRTPPVNGLARDAYLRGRYVSNERTLRGLTDSIKFYTRAIQADRNYADAYAALAESYVMLSSYGGPDPSDSLWKAQFAAERALQLDSSLSQAHTALAAVRTDRDWDWDGAEMEYRRAIQLNPDDPTAHHWYSLHLSRLGRTGAAQAEMERALALDPLSLIINTDAAETAYWARKPDEAMKRIEEVLSLNPNFAEAHLVKGKILEMMQQYGPATVEIEAAEKLFGGGASIVAQRGHLLALAGARDEALRIAKQLEDEGSKKYVSGVDVAEVYCGLGKTDDAMIWLNHAYEKRDKGINMLRIDPLFDGCRADPRYQALLLKLKLASR
jgi:TolB-like protein/DNA-binding winged helix-turn-helix (wHTH) protein/Tfp pilus assembly protein PilF